MCSQNLRRGAQSKGFRRRGRLHPLCPTALLLKPVECLLPPKREWTCPSEQSGGSSGRGGHWIKTSAPRLVCALQDLASIGIVYIHDMTHFSLKVLKTFFKNYLQKGLQRDPILRFTSNQYQNDRHCNRCAPLWIGSTVRFSFLEREKSQLHFIIEPRLLQHFQTKRLEYSVVTLEEFSSFRHTRVQRGSQASAWEAPPPHS